MATTQTECEAIAAEVSAALRVFTENGRELNGGDLRRWRALAQNTRAYFVALLAPHVDPDEMTRVETSVPDGPGRWRVIAEPPHPEPCACTAPVLADYTRDAVRCSRCLRSWRMRRGHGLAGNRPHLGYPLIKSVQWSDLLRALETHAV